MDKKTPRVLIGPSDIAGYYASLAKGFRTLGVDCDFVSFANNRGQEFEPKHSFGVIRAAKTLKIHAEKHKKFDVQTDFASGKLNSPKRLGARCDF